MPLQNSSTTGRTTMNAGLSVATASDELLQLQSEIAILVSKLMNVVNSRGDVQEQQLQSVLSAMNSIASGQFRIALSGPLTAQLVGPKTAVRQPATPQPDVLIDTSATPKPPEYTLFEARTVVEVWHERK